jgi:PST family polysaccharide transporter
VAQAAQRASGFIITAILARKLSPEDFGLMALTVITVNLMSSLQTMGISAALVQRLDLNDEHVATAFWLNSGAGAVLAAAGMALSHPLTILFKEPRIAPLLAVMMLTLPLNGMGWASDALLQRRLAFRQIAIIEWVSSLGSGLVGVALALAGAGVWSLVAQYVAASVLMTGGRLLAAGWLPRLIFSAKRARELSSFSVNALGYMIVNYGMRNVDNALVGGFLGAEALGYYSLAYNLILMPGMSLSGLVGRVAFPALASVQNDLPRFRRAYLRMLRVISTVTLPFIVGLGATAPLFIAAIYGARWMPVVPVLQILFIIGVFEALATSSTAFWAMGRAGTLLLFATISLVVMALGFAVGVRWGLLGVAWSYIVISPAVFILPHIFANRLMALRTRDFIEAMAPPLCAAAVMGVSVALLVSRGPHLFGPPWADLIAFICAGGVVYAAVLVAIGAFCGRRVGGLISWLAGRHLTGLGQQAQAVS